jgi:small-conductance mechanosensitive channel
VNYLEPVRDQVNAMVYGFLAILPNLALATVVLLVTWLVSKFAVGIASRLVGRTDLRADLKALVDTMVRLAIWIVGLLIAAAIVVPGFTPASLIAGLGIGALAIGFAFQDIFENFLAGVLIMLRDKMNIGDLIEIEGTLGKVERITLRETHVRALSNELTIMPNSMLFKNSVKILTDADIRRDEVTVGVSYDADLDTAESAIRRAFEGVEGLVPGKSVGIFARTFGASSIDFLVQWWADNSAPRDMRDVRTRVVKAIKRELDAEGIEIPFPQVTNTFSRPVPLAPVEEKPAPAFR